MRRPALLTLIGLALLAAGCGSGTTGTTAPVKVSGTVPKATSGPKGDPGAGKAAYTNAGCGGCHRFKPAASTGNVGPDLDKLAADAKKANQGSLEDYTHESIVNPSAYVVPGFQNGIMPGSYGDSLSKKQIADIVAFLTQKS